MANPAKIHKCSNATAVSIEEYETYMARAKFHFVPRMYSTTSELTTSPYFLWKYSSIKINYFSLIKKKLSPARYNILKAHSFLSFGITIAILSSLVYPLCLLFLIPWRHYLWRRLPDHSAVNWKDASVRSPRRQSSWCKSCYERDIWRRMTENHLPDETFSRMLPTSCIFVIKHVVNLILQTNILCNNSRNNEMLQPQRYQTEIHINV